MNSHLSRRRLLQVSGAGLGAGIAGCSSGLGLRSNETELEITLWNRDRANGHEVLLEVFRADADDRTDGHEVRKKFSLAEAAATEQGEEFNEESRKELLLESRPYFVRVWLSPTEYRPYTAHFHHIPCKSEAREVLDIGIVRDQKQDEVFVEFSQGNC